MESALPTLADMAARLLIRLSAIVGVAALMAITLIHHRPEPMLFHAVLTYDPMDDWITLSMALAVPLLVLYIGSVIAVKTSSLVIDMLFGGPSIRSR